MPDNNVAEDEALEDFRTHLNYVKCLRTLTDGISLSCTRNFRKKIPRSKVLLKKWNLVKLIKKSLDSELLTIKNNPEFAEVCVPWIAVKSYYLLFNLFLILEYLLVSDESCFNIGHEELFNRIKKNLNDGYLVFSKELVNRVYKVSDVLNFRIPSGYNLRTVNVDLEIRYHQLLKKLVNYCLENMLRRNNYKNWRKKKAQEKRNEYINCAYIHMCEFFYWYRIKANYRDLEFLDKNISSEQFSEFYVTYYLLTESYYKAFKGLLKNLSQIRLGKAII